jgi:ComF family protein
MNAPTRQFRSLLHALSRGLAELVLPGICPACGKDATTRDGLCKACSTELLSLVALPYCPRCGSTLGLGAPARDDGCSQCPTPLPRFTQTVRLGPYAGPIRSAVRHLKFSRRGLLLEPFARLLAMGVEARCQDRPDAVVAIPPHWRRRLSRRCDHAGSLARRLAKRLDSPYQSLLIRTRHTPPQRYLSRRARLENMRNAFAPCSVRDIAGSHLLLVDDVTTTGATANEAARTLVKAGASSVTLAVLAKSEPPTAYAEYRPAADA